MTATCLLCNNEHESGLRVCPHCGALHGLRTTTKDLNEQRVILKRLADEHASHSSPTSAEQVLGDLLVQLDFLPSSEDSKRIVWVSLREVQAAIDDLLLQLKQRGRDQ